MSLALKQSGRRLFAVSAAAVIAIFCAATVLTCPVVAQTAVEAAKVAKEIDRVASNLPPESRSVITRLTLLRELPDGAWKMHSGDLAHGEDPNLDNQAGKASRRPAKRRMTRSGSGRPTRFPRPWRGTT